MKLIIIGGGVGGLAACLALQQNGIEATVFERAERLETVGAGIGLGANATRVLQKLGLLEDILAHCGRMDWLEMKRHDGKLLKLVRLDNYEVPSVCLHRAVLLDILQKNILPERIKLGKTFQKFEQNGETVTAHFADGTAVKADALIGADGLHSAARTQLKGERQPVYRGYTVWRGIADFVPDNFRRGFISETSGAGRRFGWLPIGDNKIYWFATNNQPADEQLAPAQRKQKVIELFGDWHSPLPETIAATDENAILQNDCSDREPETGWANGRVLLLGDAAHPTTPNMGQGGCMALEDAVILARILRNQPNFSDAFRLFERERFARTKYVVEKSRKFGEVGQWQNSFAVGLRNFLMRFYPLALVQKEQHKIYGFEA
jgi:2-polyprenyl-6-methoxyphenol hydroxylase-like FAD-dependent oxidoreductase